MPVASVSSGLSWTVYFGAGIGLLGLFQPVLSEVKQESQVSAAVTTLGWFSRILNTLEPGIHVRVHFQEAFPFFLVLSGHLIESVVGGKIFMAGCRWSLPSISLPDEGDFSFSLIGSEVVVNVGRN